MFREQVPTTYRLDTVAAWCGLSRPHLSRRIRSLTGLWPKTMILGSRIEAAKHLLERDEASLSQVAYAAGFADQSHLTRVLRSRDAEGTLGLYGDTSAFVHVDNGRIIAWPELSATVRRYFSTASSNLVSVVGEPGVTVADADNAVLYLTHRFDATGARPAHGGVWTGVLHRFPEGWRIVHSHSSDRSPSH